YRSSFHAGRNRRRRIPFPGDLTRRADGRLRIVNASLSSHWPLCSMPLSLHAFENLLKLCYCTTESSQLPKIFGVAHAIQSCDRKGAASCSVRDSGLQLRSNLLLHRRIFATREDFRGGAAAIQSRDR